MFTTTSVYFLMLFLIFWSYCGYLIVLSILATLNPTEAEKDDEDLPLKKPLKMALIIPCHNEQDFVAMKQENIRALKYPSDSLQVFFLHGLSTDNTGELLREAVSQEPNWTLVETGLVGKINQINFGLNQIGKEWEIIVNSDMDTHLEPDVLQKIAETFNRNELVAVVGANISPKNCLPFETQYWRDQNLIRIMENHVYTSSIVVAPCYAYRFSLIPQFPYDCVADDVYAAFKSNTGGFITKYISSGKGYELRSPNTFDDFFRHKFRKGNAYLVELFRFFYRLPYMEPYWKVIYLTKILQLAVIPWILPYFLLSTISLALSGWGLFQVALFGVGSLLISLKVTSFIINKGRKTYMGDQEESKGRPSLRLFAVSNLILILVGLTYPFYRQTSSFEKIRRAHE